MIAKARTLLEVLTRTRENGVGTVVGTDRHLREFAGDLLDLLGVGGHDLVVELLDALLDDLATVAAEWEGLDELLHFVRDLANGLRVSAPTVASAVEFVLEGLHLNRKLNKDGGSGPARYHR